MAVRARGSRVPAVGALLVSIGVAFFSGWINLVSSDVVGGSAADDPGSWLHRHDAWQWDAITALGVAGALMAALVVSACFGARRRAAVSGAVGWALVTAALLGLVWHASSNTGAGLVRWELFGAALLAAALVRISAER
jgi:hypothetical protein